MNAFHTSRFNSASYLGLKSYQCSSPGSPGQHLPLAKFINRSIYTHLRALYYRFISNSLVFLNSVSRQTSYTFPDNLVEQSFSGNESGYTSQGNLHLYLYLHLYLHLY